jgi:two-component system response regulator PilR (NtrC family)
MSKPLCLIVDDEPDILELLVMTLERMNIECYRAETLAGAKKILASKAFDLCLTDMRLPDGNGIEIVATIGKTLPVVVITAHGKIESAVTAMKAGAFDFIAKPVKLPELRTLVKTALQLPKPSEDTSLNQQETERRQALLSKLIGKSQAMQTIRAKIEKLARSQAHIYIKGESGTGKEVVAGMIHALSARADKPFIPVNCGAIPSELMESEFFGHKKGSFSGAYNDKKGFFQSADGGTLFLDEIADLPLHMQVKLLRAIQEKQIRVVGDFKEVPVDVRILSATHRDLGELVKTDQFRQDLFYRINVIELEIPPLRTRTEDIPDLVAKILADLNNRNTEEQMFISENAIKALQQYHFPGNVRELENILERAMTLSENNMIETTDLQLPMIESDQYTEQEQKGLDPLVEKFEKEKIFKALDEANGNRTKAAKLLGIGVGALRYRLQKFQAK